MSFKPTTVADLGAFTQIIDARSPSEYAADHVPGAINCPVLDDEERRIVGTVYKQQGAFEARRIGGAMVARHLAEHLSQRFADKPRGWRPAVYCWRGGMRSGAMVQLLRQVGWDAQQLRGGYKAFRHHVIERLAWTAPQLRLRVLCGATGSGKTRLLQALEAAGAQVLDLEALACHKGSMLGSVPGLPQPSQKAFETALATRLGALDLSRPVFVEAESRRIGQLSLPDPMLTALRGGDCVVIDAPLPARVDFLLQDYDYLRENGEAFAQQLAQLQSTTGLHSRETLARWQAWARAGDWRPLVEALMREHYDPLYVRSQQGHYLRLSEARRLPLERLDEDGLRCAARLLIES